MDFDYYYPDTPSTNAEIKGVAFLTNASTSLFTDTGIVGLAKYTTATAPAGFGLVGIGTDWATLQSIRTGNWLYHKICFNLGYDTGGYVNMTGVNETATIYNITGGAQQMERQSLERIVFGNYQTTTRSLYIDNIRIWNKTAHGETPPQATPAVNASDHKVETVTKQQQTTNVTLNSVSYDTIHSYTFTPANTTQFYQTYTIPVNPTASNTLTCKVQVDGADLGSEYSRTNTAGQIGQLLIQSTNTSLTATSHQIDLLCKRTGGGSMVLYDIVGAGHLLTDLATGETIPFYIDTWSNTSTSGASYTILHDDTHTTANSNLTDMEHHVILEYTATITNNGGSAETISLIPSFGSYNCTETYRYVGAGSSGSVGGACAIKNVTGNTSYTHRFYGNGTNVNYSVTYYLKEFYLDDEDINSTSIDWTKTAETGWNNISLLNVQQDLGAGQDIYSLIGISHTGNGGLGYYEIRLDGDDTANSTQFTRQAGTGFGVLGAHNVFTGLSTGNYTTSLWANVTSITRIVGEYVSYEAGTQSTTTNQNAFTAGHNLTNATINSFTITLGGGSSYSTTTGSITLPASGLQNLTYSSTGYNSRTYTDINTTAGGHRGRLCEVNLNFTATDVEGNTVDYPYNVSYYGNLTQITSSSDEICVPNGVAVNITFSKANWHNQTTQINYTTGQHTHNFTDISNTYIYFQGATSKKDYSSTIQCSLNGTYVTKANTYNYTFYENSTTLACDAATNYPAFNVTLNTTGATSHTVNITEYSLSLTFDANVTGNVTWTHDTDTSSRGQYPAWDNTTGYNTTTFEWIRIKANWSEDTLVKVTFNEKLTGVYNSSVQYYNFRNDLDVSIVENVKVLNQLDGTLWVKVLNYAQEELIEATVRVSYCPNMTGDDCQIVSQILTEPQGGAASPGNPVYLDTTLDYWIQISKAGYESQALLVRGQDLVDDEILEVKLRPFIGANAYGFHILAPKQHSNETTIFVQTAYVHGGTYFWNTTYNSNINSASFINGAGALFLTIGNHYDYNTDFRLYLYTYDDSTGTYTEQKNVIIRYVAVDNRSVLDRIGDNTTLRVVLLIMLVLLAGIVGTYITRDGLDSGYYIFTGGTFLLAFILPAMFLPIAAIMGIIGIGSMIFSVTRE